MFIDHVTIEVSGGRGGDGCMSFRREKFVPRGGPDGGDGGHGGDVVVEASARLSTLVDLHYRRLCTAGRGGHGRGKNCRGRDGEDEIIMVPPGTVVKDARDGSVVAELVHDGDRCVVARGGRGGFGNDHFKSPRNRAPRKTTPGQEGQRRTLEITLKLVADVGLVGEPNAGKSTLLSVVSAAHPEIADYPFTTKTPVLGIVKVGESDSFVMVDIPGLIEGAHAGRGMGKDFLRHVERCRVLLYLVDAASADPSRSYEMLRNELLRYDPVLLEKPSVLAITKCDLVEGGTSGIDGKLLGMHGKAFAISSVTGEGVPSLLRGLKDLLDR